MRFFQTISLFCIVVFVASNSLTAQSKNSLVLKVKVEKVPQSAFAPGVEPPEDFYLPVSYKVLKACKGEYVGEELRVAHFGDTARDKRVGDELYIRIKRTARIRETAKSAFEAFGVVFQEESLADYEFVERVNPNLCGRL